MSIWIPVCPACGMEDWGIKGMGPATVATELIPRLTCRSCGTHMAALKVAMRVMPL
jgi:hypothetical protein